MPEFILDSGGTVRLPGHNVGDRLAFEPMTWRDLDAFTQGYITALFFTEHAPGVTSMEWNATGGNDEGAIPDDVGFADLAPETLAAILKDCQRFQASNAALLSEASERDYSDERAGHDFWLTRNGHGAGFWDRDELKPVEAEGYERLTDEIVASRGDPARWNAALKKRHALEEAGLGNRLTVAAKAFREVDVYLGDDGKVYCS